MFRAPAPLSLSNFVPNKFENYDIASLICAATEVVRVLGSGHCESIYRSAMAVALSEYSPYEEVHVPVTYNGVCVGAGRADLVLRAVPLILELKIVAKLNEQHEAQIKAYMRSLKIPVGVLVNFGSQLEVIKVLL